METAVNFADRSELERLAELVAEYIMNSFDGFESKSERDSPLFSVEEAATFLRRSKRSLEKDIKVGRISVLWVGGVRRIHRDALDAYLRSCEKRPLRRKGKRPAIK